MSIDFMRYSFIAFSLFLGFFGAGCSDLGGLPDPPAPAPIFFNTDLEAGEVTIPAEAVDAPVDVSNDAELEAWIRETINTYFKEQKSLQRFVGQGFTLESIKKRSCLGCFSATAVFAVPEDVVARKVILFSFTQWQITEATVAEERIAPLTEALCTDQGGRVFLVTEQSVCPEGMVVLGRIADLDGLRVCCLAR